MSIAHGQHLVFLGVDDIRAARVFYGDILGLRFVADEMGTLVFDMTGTVLRVSQVDYFKPQTFTVLGWQVNDIEAATNGLIEANVQPIRYQGMPQDARGIATLGGIKIVWFADPSGNILSFTQAS